MSARRGAWCGLALLLSACSTTLSAPARDAGPRDAAALIDARALDASADAALDADAALPDAGPPPGPCATRVAYGSAWIHGADHPASFDDALGELTWDGTCVDDGPNSYATLSNGWQPYFVGHSACLLALDTSGVCGAPAPACATRITYGAAWLHAPGHAESYDDVSDVVTWDGACAASVATLSNGWQPHFDAACAMSFRYTQCGGLFTNPVVALDCPDPGVARDGARYVMACTSGGAPDAYPLRTSTDLVRWTERGWIFPAGTGPAWASGDFWAPELHHVGAQWLAYFSARDASDGSLAIGVATAPSALGPYTDLGRPLVHDPTPGVIDAHEFDAPDGQHYLLWKLDGNAVGAPTPIYAQALADDGVTLLGARTELLRNDRAWEGDLVEGPWMLAHDGEFFLFYSANSYASTRYALGVARAPSPLGPFTKADAPILTSNAWWSGPGHGSVLQAPGGELALVYHAWVAGHVDAAPGRQVLVDRLTWSGGWPQLLSAPSPRSQPMP